MQYRNEHQVPAYSHSFIESEEGKIKDDLGVLSLRI